MKYCVKCGAEMQDDASFCAKCGNSATAQQPAQTQAQAPAQMNGLDIAIRVFMVIGLVGSCMALIPLIWTIPMTKSVFQKTETGEPFTTGFKVCTLLFVSLVAGVLMFCRNENKQ